MKLSRYSMMLGLLVFFIFSNAFGAQKPKFSTHPVTNHGKKWRIAYLEGGPYKDYQDIFVSTIKGLMELGWIKNTKVFRPEDPGDNREIWKWLGKQKSDYLDFVQDAYYSSDWNNAKRPEVQQALINRLNKKKDIDLVIAMGTWAGQDLANHRLSTPTVVLSCTDPLAAGIIKSVSDSGNDFLHATIDPNRFIRQVRLFHEIIGFHRLGIVYENTPKGRSYIALGDIEKVAKQDGFQLVRCFAPFSGVSLQQADDAVDKCDEELAPKVDAVYVTFHRGVNRANMKRLLAPFFKYKIPTFSQAGSFYVKHGVLMSISQASQKYVGRFDAGTIAKILNGAEPRKLSMVFEEPLRIAINLKTAQLINYNPPIDLLGAADEIYTHIKP